MNRRLWSGLGKACRRTTAPIVLATAGAIAFAYAGFAAADQPQLVAPPADRAAFTRPTAIPSPGITSQAMVELGRALFFDTRLSGDGTQTCATCHKPALGFSDGRPTHPGRDGRPLPRNTPDLWNRAWSATLFWDGHAKSLEQQAQGPIENPVEMAGNLSQSAAALARDPKMVTAFATAFPQATTIEPASILQALAAYERTLVSPKTRFDAWIDGNDKALDSEEQAGFALFTGKAQCVSCHAGWRFTDEAFHDIGLPDKGDLGRGPVIKLPEANHAFKTPSLREALWTAPYMHDGSLDTLESVIEHYADHVSKRPTLSPDMPPVLALSHRERQQLLAFIATLSSDNPPKPPVTLPNVEIVSRDGTSPSSVLGPGETVGQKDKRFTPARVSITAGGTVTIVNDDKRTHNVRIDDPRMTFTSKAQEPGDRVVIAFPDPGQFNVICSIHPTMNLSIDVGPSKSAQIQEAPR